jgi:hypothetical protein
MLWLMLELYKQFTGGTAFFTNVLFNDTLNNAPVVADQVNTTFVSATNAGIIVWLPMCWLLRVHACWKLLFGTYQIWLILNQPIVIPLPLV